MCPEQRSIISTLRNQNRTIAVDLLDNRYMTCSISFIPCNTFPPTNHGSHLWRLSKLVVLCSLTVPVFCVPCECWLLPVDFIEPPPSVARAIRHFPAFYVVNVVVVKVFVVARRRCCSRCKLQKINPLLFNYTTQQNRVNFTPFSFTPQSASFHQVVLRRIADRHRCGYPQIPTGIDLHKNRRVIAFACVFFIPKFADQRCQTVSAIVVFCVLVIVADLVNVFRICSMHKNHI